MKVFAIKDESVRLGHRLYTKDAVIKLFSKDASWELQLVEPDGVTINNDSPIFYEGRSLADLLDTIAGSTGWGIWAATAKLDKTDTILDGIFPDSETYIITLENIYD